MKILFFSLSILFCSYLFFGCKKQSVSNPIVNNIHDTVINTIHDTVCIVPSKIDILVEKQWQIDQVERSFNGQNSSYVRGGVNTTGDSYQNLKLSFSRNGTGSYIDIYGVSHPITWTMATNQQSMTITSSFPTEIFIWKMVEIKDEFLYNTTVSGNSLLITARYIQVP